MSNNFRWLKPKWARVLLLLALAVIFGVSALINFRGNQNSSVIYDGLMLTVTLFALFFMRKITSDTFEETGDRKHPWIIRVGRMAHWCSPRLLTKVGISAVVAGVLWLLFFLFAGEAYPFDQAYVVPIFMVLLIVGLGALACKFLQAIFHSPERKSRDE